MTMWAMPGTAAKLLPGSWASGRLDRAAVSGYGGRVRFRLAHAHSPSPEEDHAAIEHQLDQATFKEPVAIESDAGPSGAPRLDALAEARDDIGPATSIRILQRDEEPAGRRRVVAVVSAAPRFHVDDAVRCHGQVPGVAQAIGEHRGQKPGGSVIPLSPGHVTVAAARC
jgi:hypothetical protein